MKNLEPNDPFEIRIELISGEVVSIEGIAQPRYKGKVTLVGDCTPLYSKEERERRRFSLDEIPWINLPYGDLELDLSGGFVTIRRENEIVFMEMRDRIKKTVTLINGEIAGE